MLQAVHFLIAFVFFFSDFEAIVKLSDGFNGADLRNVCTEAGQARNSFSILISLIPKHSIYVGMFVCRFVCHPL